jgi:hypothetical protein
MSVHRRLALVTLATLLAAAACSNSGASGPTTTSLPTGSSTTVLATTATTSSTSVARTTAPTTTVPPPSTTTLDDVKKAVIAGFDAGEKAYFAALADPSDFNPDTIRATYAAGQAQTNVISALTDFQRQGFRYRPGPQGLDYYVVEDLKLGIGPPVTTADLFTCQVSDGVVYDPRDPNNPNDDAIVNAELGSHRYKWTMVVEDGKWKRLSSQELEHKTGVNACPPKPGS